MSHATSQPATPGPLLEKQRRQRPPGPRRYTAAWNTVTLARRPLSFLRELHERYGDIVTLPTIVGSWILLFRPDGVRHVIVENPLNYRKGGISLDVLSLTLGNGLATSNGDAWLHQRRLIQPVFHRERVAAFDGLMTESALAWTQEERLDAGQTLDLVQEMSGLTLNIVGKALFGADMLAHKEGLVQALATINHLLAQSIYVPGLLSLPTPQRHRLYEARATLYTVIDELIHKRRQASAGSDLLSMLIDARDEETGLGMTDQQVRDEVLTLMVAGHETTAEALCWTFLLLAQHPHIESRLIEEYSRVLGRRAAQLEDLPQLKLARMVLEESLRLYPPAWAFTRSAIAEDEIGGYSIPKGAYVLMFPALTHRHPAFWERPDDFDPERFEPSRAAGRHRFAYFPFGGGPRQCIGNQFALTEVQLLLATILPRYQFRLLPGAKVVPEPLTTLRPRGGLLVTVHRREES
jgi:enediyne biosynthesis protein E7